MAVEKIINLKVNDDIKDTENNVVSLKRQLREAQQDVQTLSDKFGATSTQAVEAAKKAAELKDRIGDAKSLTDAFNPDAKFKALTGALSGAAGAGAAFAGTMGLVGVESKDVEQALLKVQSAMAISQGLQAVGESIDQFKILKTVIFGASAAKTADTVATEANNASQSKNILGRGIQIVQTGVQTVLTGALTAATYLFNAAMAANPIGAIVAAIALLITAGYALITMFKENSAAAKKAELANKALANEIKNNKKEQDKANETFQEARDHQLGMAKASGKSAEEIRKLTLDLARQEVQQKLTNYETNRAIAVEARRVAGLKGSTDAEKKTAQEAVKLNNDSVKEVNESRAKLRKVESENAIARRQEQTDAIKDSQEKQKKANEEAINTSKENAKTLADIKLKEKEAERKLIEEKLKNDKISIDEKRNIVLADNKLTKEDRLKFLLELQDEEIKKEEAHNKSIADLNKKYDDEKANRLADTNVKKEMLNYDRAVLEIENLAKTELEKQTLIEKLNGEHAVRLADATKSDNEKKIAEAKTKADKEIEIEKAVADAKVNIQMQALDALGGLVGLAKTLGEKNKGIQKAALVAESAIGIAKIIINTQSANAAARLKYALLPGGTALAATEILLNKVSAGIGIAATLAATAKGLGALGGGGGGASGSVDSGGGGGSAAAAPSFNIVGQNPNNQLAQTIAGQQQQPLQAFVVSGNISSAQSLDRNRIDTATFN